MKKYNLIYADPPWQYSNQSTRAATKKSLPYPQNPINKKTTDTQNSGGVGNECKNDIELGGNQLCKIN